MRSQNWFEMEERPRSEAIASGGGTGVLVVCIMVEPLLLTFLESLPTFTLSSVSLLEH